MQSLEDGEASLFAVIDYTVTSARKAEPKTDTIRMEHRDDRERSGLEGQQRARA
ncbi:MAG: hypothetical protein M3124_10195 [Actinomycetota bacterium]|nr:hypothetical protein [Actinomycetota bacterium]